MCRKIVIFQFLWFATLFFSSATDKVYLLNLQADIDPVSNRYMKLGMQQAKEDSASLVLIQLNTYGGSVLDADSIVSRILGYQIPVWVFVNRNAGSAGSYISVACDSIYMSPGASIGASTVVNQNLEVMPEKVQSCMRSKFRTAAEATGRDPELCEGFVGRYLETDSAYVLSLTTQEAIDTGICVGSYESVDVLLKATGYENAELITYQLATSESIIAFFLNPIIKSVLILLIIGGIYFELQTPGIGFPLIAALVGIVFYFVPDYLHGALANWELLVFLLGVVLLALEVFVIPGFGIAGVSGISFIFISLVLSMLKNDVFDFDFVTESEMTWSLIVLCISIIGSLVLFFAGGNLIVQSKAFQRLTVQAVISEKAPREDITVEEGTTGEVYTVLKPVGKVMINDRLYDAKSLRGAIEEGQKVEVVNRKGFLLVVKEIG